MRLSLRSFSSVSSLLCAAALVVGLTCAPAPVQAQSSGSSSIYSRFGVGELNGFSSSQSQALGGGAYALRSLNYNAVQNPALWSDQVYTRFLMGARFEAIDVRDGNGNEGLLQSGSLGALHFSFPLYEEKLGVGLAFQPYSQSDFRFTRQDEVALPEGETAPYEVEYDGTGGLNLFRAGLGYKINDALRVGGAVDLLFGIRESRRVTRFAEDPTLTPASVVDEVQMFGIGGTFGGHLALSDVFLSDDALSIGASVTLPTTLSGDRVQLLENLAQPGTPNDTLLVAPAGGGELEQEVDGEIELPYRARLGVSYQFDQRWTFVADGEYGPWSELSTTFGEVGQTGSFPVGGSRALDDRWRVSTGIEVVPGGDDRLAPYLSRVAYRLGGYVEHSYVQPDRSEDVNVWGVTGGFSLPTPMSGTRIDLNGNVGRRGTTKGRLVRDTFYGVSLFVSFGERWFQQRKLR
jgi:hypothetical protein